MRRSVNCPICEKPYRKKSEYSTHHLFPSAWYISQIKVEVCLTCHRKFHKEYPIIKSKPWSVLECIKNWIDFCNSRKKCIIDIYPELLSELIK